LSRGTLPVKTRAEVRTVPRNGSGEPARAWSPTWDTVVGGSLQSLPARVMSVLPRWHTQRCGRCQNSRYLYGQSQSQSQSQSARHGPYLLVRVRVRPERHRAQSCAIALRSPAPERSSDLKRYSPDIHRTHWCYLPPAAGPPEGPRRPFQGVIASGVKKQKHLPIPSTFLLRRSRGE
jgi:hypothetical protein